MCNPNGPSNKIGIRLILPEFAPKTYTGFLPDFIAVVPIWDVGKDVTLDASLMTSDQPRKFLPVLVK
jgi:hypothetical protein